MYNQLLKVRYAFNLETLLYVKFRKSHIFSVKVVESGSETQLQVTGNLNLISQCSRGYYREIYISDDCTR